LLAALFACLAISLSLDFARGRGGPPRIVAAGLALLFGFFSKENAAVALPLTGLAMVGDEAARRLPRRVIGALAVLTLSTLVGLAARGAALGALSPGTGERVGPAGLLERLPLIVAATGEHLRLLVWPHPLSIERMPIAPTGWGESAVLGGLLVIAGWAVVAGWLWRRPRLRLLVLWPVIALLPVMHLVPIGETVAERFLVLPSVGFVGLVGALLLGEGAPTRSRVAVVAVIVAGGLALSAARARTWSDEETLWREAARHEPRSASVWAALGDSYTHRERPAEAIPHYRRALEIDPRLTAARLALAGALDATGRHDLALQETQEAVRRDPQDPVALNNLGARLARIGRIEEAGRLYRRAIEISPRYATALRNAALAAIDEGRPEEARALLERARKADPRLPGLDVIQARLELDPENRGNR
jgi:Flp pilus assembly protein TadD